MAKKIEWNLRNKFVIHSKEHWLDKKTQWKLYLILCEKLEMQANKSFLFHLWVLGIILIKDQNAIPTISLLLYPLFQTLIDLN